MIVLRIFEIIGPIMIGPSSSHTAGACRMGRAAWQILGENVKEAQLELHGSFAIKGNKEVNQALVAGLLGYDTDNYRIHRSLEDAKKIGISLTCLNVEIDGAHINTARYTLKGNKNDVCVTASSLGGGIIEVVNIDGVQLSITGNYNTMIIFCQKADETAKQVVKIFVDSVIHIDSIEQAASPDDRTQLVLVKSKKFIPQNLYDQVLVLDGVRKITNHARFK